MEGPDTLVATAAYQPEPMAAAAARRFVRDTLQSWVVTEPDADGNGLVDDAVLLTSELVTNAVVHAGTPVQVTCKLAENNVEVVVRDCQPASLVPEPPEPGYTSSERTSGRGLLLPSALASAWGVTYGRTAKAVWFRIGLGEPGLAGDESTDGRAGSDPAGPAALSAVLRRTLAAQQVPVRRDGHGPAGFPLGDGEGYRELLQRTVDSAQAAVAAEAACAMLADEDGELRVQAVAGIVPQGAVPAVVTVPFVVDGRVTGLLAATRTQRGSFQDGETARLQEIADRTGPALERARLSELDRVRHERIGALTVARDLVAGHLDQDKILALAAEAAVPRLSDWCAVLLPGPDGLLRPCAARHLDEAMAPALTWVLGSVCASNQPPGRQPHAAAGPRAAWRWPLAGAAMDDPAVPPGAAGLAGDAAWCFPFPLPDESAGALALGCRPGERLPRDAAAFAADLALRLGLALGHAALSGRTG